MSGREPRNGDPGPAVAAEFRIHGTYLGSRPHGGGHINDTFVTTHDREGRRVRHILQRLNAAIFKDPEAVMENVVRVTDECRRRLVEAGVADPSRRVLTVIPARDGRSHLRDGRGDVWRCYSYIEGTRALDVARSTRQATEAARAFGEFHHLVAGLGSPPLHETIPDFHDTRARFDRLLSAVAADPLGRLSSARREWEFIREREPLADLLNDLRDRGEIPVRITHNDTKLNNVLLDEETDTGLCVIDLDTVMPGLLLHDFGDMVRTATSPAAEDERDLSRVGMQMPLFEALARGYLSAAGGLLNESEKGHLSLSGKIITLEVGIRFLTDYLEGDIYFKTARPSHNLDRCRTQLALVASIESQEEEMQRLVDSLSR